MKKIIYGTGIFIFILDQLTKVYIKSSMELHESIEVIKNFFYITSHRNSGAAWGMLQGRMFLFYIITVVAVMGIVYLIQRVNINNKILCLGYALILGGALGNFYDRIFFKEVTDFLDFYIFGYNFPIFNVADMALVVGCGLLILDMVLEMIGEQKNG